MSAHSPVRRISKPRLALAMLLPVYPFITVLLYILAPLTADWTIWQRTLLIAPIMVTSIVFVIAPLVQKVCVNFIWRDVPVPPVS